MDREKIAIISDIHGNYKALKSVILDIKSRGINQILCLGDIAGKGINIIKCFDLLNENNVLCIKGNNDYWEIESDVPFDDSEIEVKRREFNMSHSTLEIKEQIKKFKMCHEFYMSGSLIRCFHATPFSLSEEIFAFDSLENKRKLFMPSSNTESEKWADIAVYAHMHEQSLEKIYNRTIVNVGSVGNSLSQIRKDEFDTDVSKVNAAFYVILDGYFGEENVKRDLDINFIRVDYDLEKELLSNATDNVEYKEYEDELRNARYRGIKRLNKKFLEMGITDKDIDL